MIPFHFIRSDPKHRGKPMEAEVLDMMTWRSSAWMYMAGRTTTQESGSSTAWTRVKFHHEIRLPIPVRGKRHIRSKQTPKNEMPTNHPVAMQSQIISPQRKNIGPQPTSPMSKLKRARHGPRAHSSSSLTVHPTIRCAAGPYSRASPRQHAAA
jgi:hypothetical protein